MSRRELNMEQVAELLRGGDIPTYVEQTGGGCATLYAGEAAPDANGDPRYPAAAGPGWFTQPVWREARADAADFYIGADDDGEGPYTSTDESWTEERVAAELARLVMAGRA